MNHPIQITILMCCHNRREKTLASLRGIAAQQGLQDVDLKIVLVDDGSSDGTAQAVATEFPKVIIVPGSGQLYWTGGMRTAYENAPASDFYLWMNDDTDLTPNAIQCLLNTIRGPTGLQTDALVTGAIRGKLTKKVAYGGLKRISNNRLRFAVLAPQPEAIECDGTNGNCVLIPAAAYKKLGNIDRTFVHAHGDIDFGLRAKKQGFRILLCNQYVGESETKFLEERVYSKSDSFRDWIKAVSTIKALKPGEWLTLCLRHSKRNLIGSFISPYVRTFLGRPIGFVQRPKY